MMSTYSLAEEPTTMIHAKISEINVRSFHFSVHEHIFTDPLLVLLSAFFLPEIQIVCDFSEGLT